MESKYIRLLRPLAWITFLLPFTVGFGLGITSKSNPFHVIFAFIAFISWMSFCFVVNAIADRDVDRFHNGRSKDMNLAFQPLVTDEIDVKEASYLSIAFLCSSVVFALLINPLFFSIILFVDILGYVYSMPPTRFKMRPVADVVCNAVAAAAIFTAGLSIGGGNMNPVMILGASTVASNFYIPTVVTDYEFDKKAGLRTSAVFFGPRKTLKTMYLLTPAGVALWVIVFLTSHLEIQISALIVIIYTLVFTMAANMKFKKDRLYIHENWILIPFLLISMAFTIYGVIKLLGLSVLPVKY
jgi:chlorophyll synthase